MVAMTLHLIGSRYLVRIVAEIMLIDDVDEHDLALRAQHSQRQHRTQFKVFTLDSNLALTATFQNNLPG
jgi:hypothetical protein